MATRCGTHRRRYVEPCVPLDDILEHFFETSVRAIDEDDWCPLAVAGTPPAPESNLTLMWRQPTGLGAPQIWMQYLMDPDVMDAFVPEVLYHPDIGVLYDEVKQCGIERLISPGDCEVFERISVSTSTSRLMAALSGAVGDMSRMAWGGSGDSGQNSLEMTRSRHTTRLGYPTEADDMAVVMPRHPETGELLLDFNDMTAIAMRIRSLSKPSRSLVSIFTQLPSMPKWLARLASGKMCKEYKAEMDRISLWMPRFLADDRRKQVAHDVTYIIAVLKKNSHGGPLLPIRGGSGSLSLDDWEKFDSRQNHISVYLNEFILRLGFGDAMFYDSLYGRRLVNFQAAVQRGAWELVRNEFDNRFREQRAAFRHIRGGRCAPEFAIDVEPRFLTRSPDAERQAVAESSSSPRVSPGDFNAESAFVRSTFLHFGQPDLQETSKRSKSSGL